jgi:filamentous hemagglutinin family protein
MSDLAATIRKNSGRPRVLLSGALLTSVSALALMLASEALAKDLGGKSYSGPSDAAIAAAKNAQAAAADAAQRSQSALKRATLSIQAAQSSQKAVRDWARNQLKSGIPDGLASGGMQVADPNAGGYAWVGSDAPTSVKTGDRTKITIEQTQQKSILTWETYNLSENTDLRYDQKGNRDWISLNRVLDPNARPSRILGSITADGTVLVINQNGIIFGAGAQINVGSLMASTLEVGPGWLRGGSNGGNVRSTIEMRNQNFLANGLLGYDQVPAVNGNEGSATFSALNGLNNGTVTVQEGAEITTTPGGLILLTAPQVINAGRLTAAQGQVILTAAETALTLTISTGTGIDPIRKPPDLEIPNFMWAASDKDVRGFVPLPQGRSNRSDYYVWNKSTGLIEAPQGNIYLRSPGNKSNINQTDNGGGITIGFGAAYNDGILSSTTSVSRNGSIIIDAGDVRLGEGSLLSILADPGGETIPQNPESLEAFRPSVVKIGRNADRIEMQQDALLLAPGANVEFGRIDLIESSGLTNRQEIVINRGAEINVAGLTDVLVPISENQVVIDPAKQNELRDSPVYRMGFLNGATIYLDPRKSGVRDDGVAWIGSPLIDAKAYYQLVGVGADRLMTKGGTVKIGTASYENIVNGGTGNSSVFVRDGATIDISGGWVNYEGGMIRTTKLVDSLGHVVDISEADPNRTYVAIASGFTRSSPRWGRSETWANPLARADSYYAGGYNEGRDAGVLSIATRSLAFDGKLLAQAYAGVRQISDSIEATGSSGIAGDGRLVQGSNSELPAGGALIMRVGTDIEVKNTVTPLSDGAYDGTWIGGGIADNGTYTRPTMNTGLPMPAERFGTLLVSDDLLSNSGLSQVTLSNTVDESYSLGRISIDADADIRLNAGGLFRAEGQRIEIDGNITVPSGKIALKTYFRRLEGGLSDNNAVLGDHDIVVNGKLNVAGRWVNDYQATSETLLGGAWLDGGTIEMEAAANIVRLTNLPSGNSALVVTDWTRSIPVNRTSTGVSEPSPGAWAAAAAGTAEDISGRILINRDARLNLSGGGRVDVAGKLDLTAKGGNLTLKSNTQYYQPLTGTGFRVVFDDGIITKMSVNPDHINARITFDPASIEAHGFGGGGKFTLVTPEFSLGDGSADVGARVPMDFFSKAGFGTYDITSNRTEFAPSKFGYGGYDAYAAVQTITVGAGQTLSLVQSVLPNILSQAQGDALRALETGGDVNTLVSASVPTEAYDQKAVNLRLGGLLELHVAKGGKVVGAAASSLTLGGLLNEGTIRIAGGKVVRDSTSPFVTGLNEQSTQGNWRDPIGFRDVFEVFNPSADGTIDPNGPSKVKSSDGTFVRNTDVVGDYDGGANVPTGRKLFKLGLLDQDQGIVLAAGSVTDLSGAVILNPRAVGKNGDPIRDGRIVGGGMLGTVATTQINGEYHSGGRFTAEPGAVIDLSGVEGAFDRVTQSGNNLLGTSSYSRTPVWSDGGTLLVSEGGTFAGATIRAHGGNAQAQGGTLDFADPIFTQHDPATPTQNIVSADMIAAAGFDTLVARGNVTSSGDATIKLDRAFFLMPKVWKYGNGTFSSPTTSIVSPTISAGGALEIDAPYIALQNVVDVAAPANSGTPGTGSVTFKGRQIDVTGAIRFDKSVANAVLDATGDIRFFGVDALAWQRYVGGASFQPPADTQPTLKGMLSVQGDLSLIAAQIYPTTGTSFDVTSSAAEGTITIGRSGSETPRVPYSAGGNLLIQAANIVQGGVIRVPFGTLTLGSNSAKTTGSVNSPILLAPATRSVVLADGSITSVSAGGLSIPYGTTTDTLEWYFAPTGLAALSGPPTKVLALNGRDITLAHGATIDLTGGGDVYAYEFVPGTGGSRDVLSRFNSDQYSSNNYADGVGTQYPDARPVYAIVPGLSDAPVAAYDPIYSADYGDLGSTSGVGRRVYLAGGNGLKAGWYTLLPAQYAMLPDGMRVVEQTGVKNAIPGSSYKRPDGTVLVSGTYGDALSGATESVSRQFSVQSQEVIKSYSNIVLASGNAYALSQAAAKGIVAPRNGLDAGRLALNPLSSIQIDTLISSAAANGGRGSQVDVSGSRMEIVSTAGTPAAGVVQLTVDSLNNLNAESLLIGATRIDNTDGTTNLNVTANSIVVANDELHPLIAPEIVLAVDDIAYDAQGKVSPVASSLVLNDGATLIATGTLNDQRSGAYVVDGRVIQDGTGLSGNTATFRLPANTAIGALFRVANGPQRVVQRLRSVPNPDLLGNTNSPTGPDATLTVGDVNVSGGAIGLDTSHNVTVGSAAKLAGRDIALGVGRLAFTDRGAAAGTVVITPELQAILAQGDRLTLRSQTSIGFDNGSYSFKSVAFDAATLESLEDGGSVTIGGDRVQFGNSGAAGAAAGGSTTLNVDAGEIVMGNGTTATIGFGAGVNLTARNGLFSAGKDGVLDVGAANLAIVTSYMGDRGVPGVFTNAPTGMSFKTIGNVAISNAGTAMPDLTRAPGIPGSSLSIEGNNVTIAGAHLRSTAGALTVKATGAIALSGSAVLESPGYEQTFGDAADPQTKAAPGGTITLASLGTGGVALGNARLSVGNGKGNAGTLKLSSQNGVLDWGTATLDGRGGAGGQGGVFAIDTKGAIDLVGLNTRVGADGFTGQTLTSGSVNLTADGGSVIIGGTIDTSGVNGGNIALYGTRGVSLQGSALLDAHANGYAADDTRQAKAGDVTLGTDFVPGSAVIGNDGVVSGTSGVITVAAGARIDVSAKRPGDRLVRLLRNGVVNYAYAEGDKGGTVTFRAPVIGNGSGADTVNVAVASAQSVVGAREVDLVGFKRWDLKAVSDSNLFKGVKYDAATNTVTLDVAEDLDTAKPDGGLASVGGVNFLGDEDTGTIADFVQNYDVSAAYANLGGLAQQTNFHSRPGIDLAHTGNIVLKSNWNLAAGRVNLLAAQTAGYMTRLSVLQAPGVDTSGYVVKGGFEDEIFENLTKFTYRTNHGDVRGEAPVLNLRAGGDLDLNGSLTDGFFLFRDQTDRIYRSLYGTSTTNLPNWNNYILTLNGGFLGNSTGRTPLLDWAAWNGATALNNYLGLSVATRSAAYFSQSATPSIPYTAVGNSPAARGTFVADALGNVDGGGDPISSAEVFPLFHDGTAAQSSSYSLVAGAANLAGGSVTNASADPSRVNAASSASITVAGRSFYQVPGGSGIVGIKIDGINVDGVIAYGGADRPSDGQRMSVADWMAYITGPTFRGVSDTSVAVLNIGDSTVADDDPNRALIVQLFHEFEDDKLVLNSTDPNIGWRRNPTATNDADMVYIAMSVKNFKAFVNEKLIPALATIEANIEAAAVHTPTRLPEPTSTKTQDPKSIVRPLIRTGTGSIAMSAAGDVDLTGGPLTYLNKTGEVTTNTPAMCGNNSGCSQQLGGVAVYTAGHRVAAFTKTLTDPVTGVAVAVSTPASKSSNFLTPGAFSYGGAGNAGTMIADPAYLAGGGDITVTAQGDVLGRRRRDKPDQRS